MSSQIAKRGGGFALQPQDMDQAMSMADMLAHSKMVPKGYQGQPQDTLVAMMMGSELGLNPIQALQHIAVINGKPSIYGDALLALVQSHPAFGGIKEEFDEELMLAKCSVKRKGSDHWHTATFSQADAKHAGLWGKAGPWQTYPKRMLQMRARGFALRDTFADALAGLITAEEAEDMPVDDHHHAPAPAPAPAIEPQEKPAYPQERFDEKWPRWESAIKSGQHTAQAVIATIESSYSLTDEQRDALNNITVEEAEHAAS